MGNSNSTGGDRIMTDDLRARVIEAAGRIRGGGWAFCDSVAEAVEARAYLDWGFPSVAAWFQADLPAFAPNYSHYIAAGRFLRSLPEGDREQWRAHDVFTVLACGKLLKSDPAAALALVRSGASCAKIRQKAAAVQPDQHQESEWRTIPAIRVSVPVYWLWTRALNRARYEACEREPSMERLIECLCAALTNEPLAQPQNGIDPATWYNAVHNGEIRCAEPTCGSYDRTQLDWHHAVARSSNGAESAQVPLCRDCHTRIQPRWRAWLEAHPELHNLRSAISQKNEHEISGSS